MDQLPTWLIIIVLLLGAVAATGLITLLTAVVIRVNRPIPLSTAQQESPVQLIKAPAPEITFIEEKTLLPSHPDNPQGGANPPSSRSSTARKR